jgi:hypothetical protein
LSAFGKRRLSENTYLDRSLTVSRARGAARPNVSQAARKGPGKGRLFSKDCTLTSNVKADDRGGISGTNRCFRCDAAEQFD